MKQLKYFILSILFISFLNANESSRALLEKARTLQNAGEVQRASLIFKQVMQQSTDLLIVYEAELEYLKSEASFPEKINQLRSAYRRISSTKGLPSNLVSRALFDWGTLEFDAGHYERSFLPLRQLVQMAPFSEYSDQTWFLIARSHFELGNYSRAIQSFEKVGATNLKAKHETVKIGSRLLLRTRDRDLLLNRESAYAKITTASGDSERCVLTPLMSNMEWSYASINTSPGKITVNDNVLQCWGNEEITIEITDQYHSSGEKNKKLVEKKRAVYDAKIACYDAAYQNQTKTVTKSKPLFIKVIDLDRNKNDSQDQVVVEVKLQVEDGLEKAKGGLSFLNTTKTKKWKTVEKVNVHLKEEEKESSFLTGTFRGRVDLKWNLGKVELIKTRVLITYSDTYTSKLKASQKELTLAIQKGEWGDLKAPEQKIQDEMLSSKVSLGRVTSLRKVGQLYKDFGLEEQALIHFDQAMVILEKLLRPYLGKKDFKLDASTTDAFIELYRLKFLAGKSDAALELLKKLRSLLENDAILNELIIDHAHFLSSKKKFREALSVWQRLNYRGSAYQDMAIQERAKIFFKQAEEETKENAKKRLNQSGFQELERLLNLYPQSSYIDESVVVLVENMYDEGEYERAIQVFEPLLLARPDAPFIDKLLYNYGRCLYKTKRYREALMQFRVLLKDHPSSSLAVEAKKISHALSRVVK